MDADPDPVIPKFIGDNDQGKAFTTTSFPLSVNLIKLPSLAEQGSLREFIT